MGTQRNVPDHLTPVWLLCNGPVEVIDEVTLKTVKRKDQDGNSVEVPKTSKHFDGRQAYVVPVEAIKGLREKVLPEGQTTTVVTGAKFNVTVWAESAPKIEKGKYVRFHDLMVGVFSPDGDAEPVLYFQARGVSEYAMEQHRQQRGAK